VAPVAHEIDHHVLFELLAVRNRDPHGENAGLGVVRVHVQHGNLEAFRQIARVVRAARVDRVGGEPDLIVGHDVERSTHAITAQQREVERLSDHALARE
jgi:hypothetical protein